MMQDRLAVLDNEQIRRLAPAAFATAPHSRMSGRYSFLPTVNVIDAMRGAGWQPVQAIQSKARDVSRFGLQRHGIRFRHADATVLFRGADVVPELLLLNSHDGSSGYQLHAGLFRMICGNGLVVADATFAKASIRHTGISSEQVIDASFEIVREVPKLAASVEGMRQVQLSDEEQRAFAGAAAQLRWEENKAPVEPWQLLTGRRSEDNADDLWTTFNRVQENVIRGGQRGRTTMGRKVRTRAIGSVTEDTRLNKALWHLAEEMRRLKTGVASAA